MSGTAAGIAAAVAVSHASLAPVRAYLAAAQNLEFKIEGSAALELEQQLVSSMHSEQHAVDAVTTFHTWLTVCLCKQLSHPLRNYATAEVGTASHAGLILRLRG